jgi:uncharacterized protein with beta-barrel porin domain
MSAQPTINRQEFTHVSLTVNVDGKDYFGVTDLSYGTERDTNPVHGTGANQVGVALGPVKHSASIEMVKTHANRLRRALGNGYMSKILTITGTWRETSMSELSTVVISAYVKKDDTKSTQGADPTKETLELHVNQIERDGIKAVEEET